MTPLSKPEIKAILKLMVKMAQAIGMTKQEIEIALERAWRDLK